MRRRMWRSGIAALLAVSCGMTGGGSPKASAPPGDGAIGQGSLPPRAEQCLNIAQPNFADVDWAALVNAGRMTPAQVASAQSLARERDTFDARRLTQLCLQRVGAPEDPALALAFDTALSDRRAAVQAAIDAVGDPAADPMFEVLGPDKDANLSAGIGTDDTKPAKTGTGAAPPPSPPPVAAGPASVERMERYPRIIAPNNVTAGQRVTVLVGLSMNPSSASASTVVVEGTATGTGAMVLELPALPPEIHTWKIDVLLAAPAFEIKSQEDFRTIELPRFGDSTLAQFDLSMSVNPTGDRTWINAYLFHDGAMIGQIGRELRIETEASRTVVANTTGTGAVVRASSHAHEVHLIALDTKRALVIVGAPGKQPSHTFVDFDSGALQGFLGPKWGTIRSATRGIDPADPNPQASTLVRGLGVRLWELTPAPIRDHLLSVWDDPKVDSLRVYTNVPAFPWELVQPQKPDGKALTSLGTRFRLGRWHLQMGPVSRTVPPDRLPYRELVAVMPNYDDRNALPALTRERQALAKVFGFRQIDARIAQIGEIVKAPPDGILHFAGHGVAAEHEGAATSYAIRLEDGDLDALALRGLPDNRLAQGHTLVFFNACEVGQSSTSAGLVEGWAPAMLDAGASGYIGALWPVGDAEAADFAATFYGEIERSIAASGEARVTDVLRCMRNKGVSRQDPTWQAYVFYGDPDTVLYRDNVIPSGLPYKCGA